MQLIRTIVPVLTLIAVTAGCSSSDGKSEQRLTEQRESYCTELGAWQKARDAAGEETAESAEFDDVGAIADDAFLAMEPLRGEAVGGGRTLGEATMAAMKNSDGEALGRVVKYCQDAGFESQAG